MPSLWEMWMMLSKSWTRFGAIRHVKGKPLSRGKDNGAATNDRTIQGAVHGGGAQPEETRSTRDIAARTAPLD
jgi:hypothetical protein